MAGRGRCCMGVKQIFNEYWVRHGIHITFLSETTYCSRCILVCTLDNMMIHECDFKLWELSFKTRLSHPPRFILTKPPQNSLLVEKCIADSVPSSPLTNSMVENVCTKCYCCTRTIYHLYTQLLECKFCKAVSSDRYEKIIPSRLPWIVVMHLASTIADDRDTSEARRPLSSQFFRQWIFLELFLNSQRATKKLRVDATHCLVDQLYCRRSIFQPASGLFASETDWRLDIIYFSLEGK